MAEEALPPPHPNLTRQEGTSINSDKSSDSSGSSVTAQVPLADLHSSHQHHPTGTSLAPTATAQPRLSRPAVRLEEGHAEVHALPVPRPASPSPPTVTEGTAEAQRVLSLCSPARRLSAGTDSAFKPCPGPSQSEALAPAAHEVPVPAQPGKERSTATLHATSHHPLPKELHPGGSVQLGITSDWFDVPPLLSLVEPRLPHLRLLSPSCSAPDQCYQWPLLVKVSLLRTIPCLAHRPLRSCSPHGTPPRHHGP
jgi:hypothetical protein